MPSVLRLRSIRKLLPIRPRLPAGTREELEVQTIRPVASMQSESPSLPPRTPSRLVLPTLMGGNARMLPPFLLVVAAHEGSSYREMQLCDLENKGA